MIGLDSNVLLRYLVQDDPVQSATAERLIDALTPQEPGFVSLVALVETTWVLSRSYKVPRQRIAEMIDMLLRVNELVVESAHAARLALATYAATHVDFADALIAQSGRLAGCRDVFTFDERAAASAGMRLLTA